MIQGYADGTLTADPPLRQSHIKSGHRILISRAVNAFFVHKKGPDVLRDLVYRVSAAFDIGIPVVSFVAIDAPGCETAGIVKTEQVRYDGSGVLSVGLCCWRSEECSGLARGREKGGGC